MEELFQDLVGFLMDEGVPTDNAAEILAGEGNDDHMMPTGTISSFSNGIDDHELEADWYTQFPELHLPDHHEFGEEHIYDDHPSNSDIRSDNILLDVNDYFQENDCLIDQYIQDVTGPLQQQANNNCHDHHQPQSSTSVIPVIPHIDDSVLPINIVNDDQLLNNSSTPEQQVQDRRLEPQERRSKLIKQVGEPNAKRPKRRKKDKQVLVVNHGEEEDDALGAAEGDIFTKEAVIDVDNTNADDDDITLNLVSERNRRKRLNQQLFTLRGLVPCITRMDKRSVLVDALAFLQDILHQTQTEIEDRNSISCAAATEDPGHAVIDSPPMSPDSLTANVDIHHPPYRHLGVILENSVINANVEGQPQPIMSTILGPSATPYGAIFPAITQMEAEKVDAEIYMLKIVYNKALGSMSQVQRSVEMLKGFDFISVSVSEYNQHHMQSSSFLRKIKGSLPVTDEKNLLERVKVTAKQLGLNLLCDASSAED
ncbi:hypothetical protein MKX01_003874 [Papaver californicum]|nr:hypothetical protein MKX01_003874 [Papaver californicum]